MFPNHRTQLRPNVFDRIRKQVADTIDRAVATGSTVQCKACGNEQPPTDFDRDRGRLTCRACLREERRIRDFERKEADPFSVKLRSLRAGAAKRGYAFSITPLWCHEQWDRQKGRCAYSFMPLDLFRHRRGPLECSFDRIDSAGGYTTDNVVLCAYAFNVFKSSMPVDDCLWLFEAMAANRREVYDSWHQDPAVIEHLRKLRGIASMGGFMPQLRPPGRKKAIAQAERSLSRAVTEATTTSSPPPT